jgi:glucose-1-phosphate thymidylyltransferase
VAIVGVIPAAGYATRLQPLRSSKETQAIRGRPVMDFLLERMVLGGCSELRVVTRPEKRDVIENARRLGAAVIEAYPASPAASMLAGMRGLAADDVVLFGFPDSIWEPVDGFRSLAGLVDGGAEVALGLFRTSLVERPDVAVLSPSGLVTEIDVGSDSPPPHLIWGCGAARARALSGLRDEDDPGDLLSSLCGTDTVAGAVLSDAYVDVGTRRGLRLAREAQAIAR